MKTGLMNKGIVTIYESCDTVIDTEDGTKSTISDEGLYGQKFVVLASQGNFVKIRTQYNYEGYVRKSDVLFLSNEKDDKRDNEIIENKAGCNIGNDIKKMWIIKPYADVLSIPSVSGERLISITRGAVVMAGNEKDGYTEVFLYDGRKGYTKSSYLIPYVEPVNGDAVEKTVNGESLDMSAIPQGKLDEDSFRKNVINTAKLYLGTQYRWGGKSPLGIDCSGLTSISYMLNGVLTYRDAKIKPGFPVKEIAFVDKKPGDLIYFPGHIAMYIGNDEYIHSTAKTGSDGVVINSFDKNADNYRDDLPKKILAVGSIFT